MLNKKLLNGLWAVSLLMALSCSMTNAMEAYCKEKFGKHYTQKIDMDYLTNPHYIVNKYLYKGGKFSCKKIAEFHLAKDPFAYIEDKNEKYPMLIQMKRFKKVCLYGSGLPEAYEEYYNDIVIQVGSHLQKLENLAITINAIKDNVRYDSSYQRFYFNDFDIMFIFCLLENQRKINEKNFLACTIDYDDIGNIWNIIKKTDNITFLYNMQKLDNKICENLKFINIYKTTMKHLPAKNAVRDHFTLKNKGITLTEHSLDLAAQIHIQRDVKCITKDTVKALEYLNINKIIHNPKNSDLEATEYFISKNTPNPTIFQINAVKYFWNQLKRDISKDARLKPEQSIDLLAHIMKNVYENPTIKQYNAAYYLATRFPKIPTPDTRQIEVADYLINNNVISEPSLLELKAANHVINILEIKKPDKTFIDYTMQYYKNHNKYLDK